MGRGSCEGRGSSLTISPPTSRQPPQEDARGDGRSCRGETLSPVPVPTDPVQLGLGILAPAKPSPREIPQEQGFGCE